MKFLTKLGEPVNKNLKTAQNSKIINAQITKNDLLMHILKKSIYGVECDKDSVISTRSFASKLILNWSENDTLSIDILDEIVEKIHDHICVGDTMIGFPVPRHSKLHWISIVMIRFKRSINIFIKSRRTKTKQ